MSGPGTGLPGLFPLPRPDSPLIDRGRTRTVIQCVMPNRYGSGPQSSENGARAVVGDHDHDGVSVVGLEQHHDVERGRVTLKGLLDPIWIAPRDGYLVAKMGLECQPLLASSIRGRTRAVRETWIASQAPNACALQASGGCDSTGHDSPVPSPFCPSLVSR